MAVTKTGSTITIQSGDDGSQSITVPADADICVVMCSLYAGTPNWIVANPVTLAGTNLTTAEKTDNQTSNGHVWIGYIVSPSTGSQTLAWNFTVGTVNEGINFVVTFWTGVDTASPIVDSGKQTTSGADLTGLSADSGDMMVGCAYSYNSTHTSVTDNSQTELTRSTYNSAGLGAAYKDGGTGFYFTGGSYTTCAAIVIAAETTTEYDAAVSPLVVEATLTSTTATYASALSAAVSPVAVQATVVAVTATYAGVYSASVSPVAVQATLPAVTATYVGVYSAAVSPLSVQATIPAITATYASALSATVAPVVVQATVTATTATYVGVYSAAVSPVAVAVSLPAVTATAAAGAANVNLLAGLMAGPLLAGKL